MSAEGAGLNEADSVEEDEEEEEEEDEEEEGEGVVRSTLSISQPGLHSSALGMGAREPDTMTTIQQILMPPESEFLSSFYGTDVSSVLLQS